MQLVIGRPFHQVKFWKNICFCASLFVTTVFDQKNQVACITTVDSPHLIMIPLSLLHAKVKNLPIICAFAYRCSIYSWPWLSESGALKTGGDRPKLGWVTIWFEREACRFLFMNPLIIPFVFFQWILGFHTPWNWRTVNVYVASLGWSVVFAQVISVFCALQCICIPEE